MLVNYAAQVPYAAHLYGTAFSRAGALLLGLTLAWFVLGYLLLARHRPAGYWVLLAYAVAQFAFYFHCEVLLAFAGYGLPLPTHPCPRCVGLARVRHRRHQLRGRRPRPWIPTPATAGPL